MSIHRAVSFSPASPAVPQLRPGAGLPGSIAVVLVNFNTGPLLAQALDSLARQHRVPDEIIVVDNGSTDGSLGLVDWAGLPQARLLVLPCNQGFAAASNIAVRLARSQWIAMLNSDAVAAPDWLEAMAQAAARRPEARFFASAQVLIGPADRIDGFGDVYSVTGLTWRGGHGGALAAIPREGRCFGACAAGAFVSRRLFLQLGGFEESFFCYLEDVDFAYRALLAGHDCVFVPGARIRHHSGGSSGAKSGWTLRISARNRLHLYLRNTPLVLMILTWPMFLLGVLLSLAQGLRHGKPGAVLLGLAEGVLGLRLSLAQRRRLRPPILPPLAVLAAISWNPFGPLTRSCRIRPLARPAARASPVAVPVPAE